MGASGRMPRAIPCLVSHPQVKKPGTPSKEGSAPPPPPPPKSTPKGPPPLPRFKLMQPEEATQILRIMVSKIHRMVALPNNPPLVRPARATRNRIDGYTRAVLSMHCKAHVKWEEEAMTSEQRHSLISFWDA